MKRVQTLLVLPIALLIGAAMVAVPAQAEGGGSGGSGGGSSSGGSGSGDTSGDSSISGSSGSASTSDGSSTGSTSSGTSDSGSGSSHSSGTSKSGSNEAIDSPSSSTTETEAETHFHAEGQTLLSQAEKEHKSGKSQAEIQKVCDARKNGIQTRTATLVTRAQNSLNRITTVFSEITTYQKRSGLSAANFDTLVATAAAAQSTAATSVKALAAVVPTIDCASTSAASELATFKAAVTQARTDLIAYRGAVRNVVIAVENAKDTTSGGQQ